jgi:hypothetical protein
MSRGDAAHTAFVDGVALWAPTLPGWVHAESVLGRDPPRATAAAADAGAAPAARPAPRSLAANERRRAPDSVLAALRVAEDAVAMSGRSAATLASVFTSAHGDLPILDAMLRSLAAEPQLLSPMRFHHSVHNAPSGYWAIAAGSHAASTALAGFEHSAGAGLLEGLVQVAAEAADDKAVLVVGCDTGASGPLASVNASRGLLAWALVLAAGRGPASRFALDWHTAARAGSALSSVQPSKQPSAQPSTQPQAPRSAHPSSPALAPLWANAQAPVLPLFEALAVGRSEAQVSLPCGAHMTLELRVRPQGRAG